MSAHPLVLLVEPNPLLRELLHGELKDQGCIVVDAVDSEEALAFAKLYPGAIDLAVTDLRRPTDADRTFLTTLRSLPTGGRARVLQLKGEFDRESLVRAVRRALPATRSQTIQAPRGNRAVFWGTGRDTGLDAAAQ